MIDERAPLINIDNIVLGNSLIMPPDYSEHYIYATYKLLADGTAIVGSSLYTDTEVGCWLLSAFEDVKNFECKYIITALDANTKISILESSIENNWYDGGLALTLRCNTPPATERIYSELGTIVFDIIVREKINTDNCAVVSGQISILPQINLGA